jgi:hypothetical protein
VNEEDLAYWGAVAPKTNKQAINTGIFFLVFTAFGERSMALFLVSKPCGTSVYRRFVRTYDCNFRVPESTSSDSES